MRAGFLCRFGLAAALQLALAGAALAVDCKTGAAVGVSVAKEEYCDAFVQYKKPGEQPVDDRIANRFPPESPDDLEIRSFAVVISIYNYPNFEVKAEQIVAPVQKDLPNILAFLKEQKFDEIILLKNDQATKEAIDYFLNDYIFRQVKSRKNRARFLFAYDGHGAPGPDDSLPGALALAASRGENDNNPAAVYSLGTLREQLQSISAFTLQAVALLGSCYSGGVLFPNVPQTASSTYALGPGAHAVTAVKANAAVKVDELAWGYAEDSGTVFATR
jgi:hypothetical protein